jgi:hypothetical protein
MQTVCKLIKALLRPYRFFIKGIDGERREGVTRSWVKSVALERASPSILQ